MVYKKKGRCRDDWFSTEDEAACGFKSEDGTRIFDSQVRALTPVLIIMLFLDLGLLLFL